MNGLDLAIPAQHPYPRLPLPIPHRGCRLLPSPRRLRPHPHAPPSTHLLPPPHAALFLAFSTPTSTRYRHLASSLSLPPTPMHRHRLTSSPPLPPPPPPCTTVASPPPHFLPPPHVALSLVVSAPTPTHCPHLASSLSSLPPPHAALTLTLAVSAPTPMHRPCLASLPSPLWCQLRGRRVPVLPP